MVQNSEPWQLGEPELNGCGQPVIENIAENLGFILPHGNEYAPRQPICLDNETDMMDMVTKIDVLQRSNNTNEKGDENGHTTALVSSRTDIVQSSECMGCRLDHTHLGHSLQPDLQPAFDTADKEVIWPETVAGATLGEAEFNPLGDFDISSHAATTSPHPSPCMPPMSWRWPTALFDQQDTTWSQQIDLPHIFLQDQVAVESEFGAFLAESPLSLDADARINRGEI